MAVLPWAVRAAAETIVLNDGTVIDGEILIESKSEIRVKTPHGIRNYKRKDIKQILASKPELGDVAKDDFSALPDVSRQILNARALYLLDDYQGAIDRVKPFLDPKGTDWNQMLIRWQLIHCFERLAKFDEAKEMLNYVKEHGDPADKIRADAHLQIFADNPNHDLRVVGDKFTRYFITDQSLEIKAKEAGSLADPKVMGAALREYCDQILLGDEVSVDTFARSLKVDETLRAIENAREGTDAAKALPYLDRLKKVEASLYRVQSVMPGYADAYELDLVRVEADHMLDVVENLFGQAMQLNPENFPPAADTNTGQLTPEGRREWRERCDEFLRRSKATVDVTEYFLEKLQRYPRDLRELIKLYSERLDRLTQMRHLATQRRERSRI